LTITNNMLRTLHTISFFVNFSQKDLLQHSFYLFFVYNSKTFFFSQEVKPKKSIFGWGSIQIERIFCKIYRAKSHNSFFSTLNILAFHYSMQQHSICIWSTWRWSIYPFYCSIADTAPAALVETKTTCLSLRLLLP